MIYLRQLILKLIKPFLVWVSGKHLPYTHKKITGEQYEALAKLIEPGDVLVSRLEGDLTTALILGFWTHGAIYTLKGVVEAEGKGVILTSLIDFVMTKDFVLLVRPKLTRDHRVLVSDFAKDLVGFPYDYTFSAANEAYYCSELVWTCYARATIKLGISNPIEMKWCLNCLITTPDDLARSGDIIFDSRRDNG